MQVKADRRVAPASRTRQPRERDSGRSSRTCFRRRAPEQAQRSARI